MGCIVSSISFLKDGVVPDDALQRSFGTLVDAFVQGFSLSGSVAAPCNVPATSPVSLELLGLSGGSRLFFVLSFGPFTPEWKVSYEVRK